MRDKASKIFYTIYYFSILCVCFLLAGFLHYLIKLCVMKQTIKKTFSIAVILLAIAFSFSGCYESHYYHHYNHHTQGWYDHHHQSYPAGVDFRVDVR